MPYFTVLLPDNFARQTTVNRNRMVWKAGELQRAAANMLRHKGSESHLSNSVHALERST
jgi:hypothetical protein